MTHQRVLIDKRILLFEWEAVRPDFASLWEAGSRILATLKSPKVSSNLCLSHLKAIEFAELGLVFSGKCPRPFSHTWLYVACLP